MNIEPVLMTYFPSYMPQLIVEDKITPVLLVSVNNPDGQKMVHDNLKQICSRFGDVRRVRLRNYLLIFFLKDNDL